MASALSFPLYAVGGFVRDLLLGQPNFDVDLVVEGDAIRLAQALAQRFGGRVRSHRRFGTAKWILPESLTLTNDDGTTYAGSELPESLDFVTARTEFYEHPTALPTVERSSIKQDLHRRDFTINTLAVRLTPDHWGELLDFYGGRKDLADGMIRVLHSLSFVEDPTRILRAARFEQRFAFRIEPRTEELIAGALDLLDRVSAERVRHELELILAEAEPERALCRLGELNVLARLHPQLRCDAWFRAKASELRAALGQVSHPHNQSPAAMTLTPAAAPRLHLALLTYPLPGCGRGRVHGAFPHPQGVPRSHRWRCTSWQRRSTCSTATTSSPARSSGRWMNPAKRRAWCCVWRATTGWCASGSTCTSAGCATCGQSSTATICGAWASSRAASTGRSSNDCATRGWTARSARAHRKRRWCAPCWPRRETEARVWVRHPDWAGRGEHSFRWASGATYDVCPGVDPAGVARHDHVLGPQRIELMD